MKSVVENQKVKIKFTENECDVILGNPSIRYGGFGIQEYYFGRPLYHSLDGETYDYIHEDLWNKMTDSMLSSEKVLKVKQSLEKHNYKVSSLYVMRQWNSKNKCINEVVIEIDNDVKDIVDKAIN